MAEDRNKTLTLDIDQIVREVLRRLPQSERLNVESGVERKDSSNPAQLLIQQRVVTLDALDGKLNGAKQVVVPRGAVVTPAVRDALRQAGVALTYESNGQHSVTRDKHRLTIGCAETAYEAMGLIRAIEEEYESVQQIANSGLLTVIDDLTAQVARGGDLGLLLTGQPAAATCLANRQRGVRAMAANRVGDVAEAIHQIGLNMLIVDPLGRGIFELKQMAKAFAASGARKCPAGLQQRLN